MMDDLRKLDAEFAERVLGLTTGTVQESTPYGSTRVHWCAPGDNQDYDDLPTYTRSLDAAWPGVEKVINASLFSAYFQLKSGDAAVCREDGWIGTFIYPRDCASVDGPACTHPAEALVRACLEAVKDG